jgi:hypothetical protein
VKTLDEMASLLVTHGEARWSAWLDSARSRIRAGDLSGVTHLLFAYGGMGSFNDLVLHPSNGHAVGAGDIDQVNATLSALRSRAWNLGTEVSREAVIE